MINDSVIVKIESAVENSSLKDNVVIKPTGACVGKSVCHWVMTPVKWKTVLFTIELIDQGVVDDVPQISPA